MNNRYSRYAIAKLVAEEDEESSALSYCLIDNSAGKKSLPCTLCQPDIDGMTLYS
jgi:hypothetical protein